MSATIWAKMSVLPCADSGITCEVTKVRGRWLEVLARADLPMGCPVSVETSDHLYLGTVEAREIAADPDVQPLIFAVYAVQVLRLDATDCSGWSHDGVEGWAYPRSVSSIRVN